MPLGIADMAPLCHSGSLGDLLRAQVGHADRAKELLLATDSGRVLSLHGRDSFPVLHLERFQLGLPGCFASRLPCGVKLIPVLGVVRVAAPAVAGLAVRPSPTRLGAVDAEAFFLSHDAAFGAGFWVTRHQGRKRGGFF